MRQIVARARAWDERTKNDGDGRHGGIVGRTALGVLRVLVSDFFNYRTGRLDPSYQAIARKAGVCVRTVASALKRLKDLRILSWTRRCHAVLEEGFHSLRQDTNAYRVEPPEDWLGEKDERRMPPPVRATWAAPRMPDGLAEYGMEMKATGDRRTALSLLRNEGSGIAMALASLGDALAARRAEMEVRLAARYMPKHE